MNNKYTLEYCTGFLAGYEETPLQYARNGGDYAAAIKAARAPINFADETEEYNDGFRAGVDCFIKTFGADKEKQWEPQFSANKSK